MRALVVAAPASGAGKTVLTLGLLRALGSRGRVVAAAKAGPDYIDPQFHRLAAGRPSLNLDGWAMSPTRLRALAAQQGAPLLIVEGAMGALDAAADGSGSAADVAAALGAPLLLVLDVSGQGQSAALAPAGLRALRPDVPLAGAILNRVASPRHEAIARSALASRGVTVFGAVPRSTGLHLPSRHLGLVLPAEVADAEAVVSRAAEIVAAHVDLEAVCASALPLALAGGTGARLPPPGQRIALAEDAAFVFTYPHLLADWRARGAEILPFAPLDDHGPPAEADAVFLPGGYPELHAGRLAASEMFRHAMEAAVARGAVIWGECGGYMALGEALVDAEGRSHRMLGMLPLVTSFAERRLTLGYRRLAPRATCPWQMPLAGHEFHYATIRQEGTADRVFDATDAAGEALPAMGLACGRVAGSFAHVIGPMEPRE
ncbi:MAG TPA: cobyrinate a,c-diamide synthase [Amaricoccus sp.]|uniref:cobyrinate a,c-diamide synthase n=1 Tax=Amaricoccus sp. TaxID=1872485 RepID=UPI002C031274|nr:cobyrinate a,c-diamide synthase [Amaricoccus sp.]HMQ94179.1 cobyrinate a,c-diamide synthase [Amaricoccus sp.]HMR53164.1 cobyrinate a,c-diamide synthase [Amaricoccus sp.]HMU00060.1 cobyrinate a,c-diamide synthase [Amaricoccus sp.]